MNELHFDDIKTLDTTLPELVADQISQLIVNNRMSSNDKLPSEFELARQLNVGRGTVREAVKLLVARNVLEIRRGKGTFISENPGAVPDPLGFAYYPDKYQLAMDLMEVRLLIEKWIAEIAAQKATKENISELWEKCHLVEEKILAKENHIDADVEFHTCMAKCTQNLVAPRFIPIITYSVRLFGELTHNCLRTETMIGHRAMTNAIAQHDSEAAVEAIVHHIAINRDLLQKLKPEIEAPRTSVSK